ncbi:hypothetical protein ABT352_11440 [Streptosporangium sp. NPDC000563]|uniref:hypothetical protein n=1 Tax=Streptosporangium sp. NPDC000563 TaxID=3154366 RepID=UPI003317781F
MDLVPTNLDSETCLPDEGNIPTGKFYIIRKYYLAGIPEKSIVEAVRHIKTDREKSGNAITREYAFDIGKPRPSGWTGDDFRLALDTVERDSTHRSCSRWALRASAPMPSPSRPHSDSPSSFLSEFRERAAGQQEQWYDFHMTSSYRTKDGHTVGLGSTVWAINGQGPFKLTKPDSAPPGWVYMVSADGEDMRLHAPEDVAIYYNRNRRVES